MNLNPLYPWMLCAKFGWNWPKGSEEKVENVKRLQTKGRTNRQTPNATWSKQLTDFSFQLKWAKKEENISACYNHFTKSMKN